MEPIVTATGGAGTRTPVRTWQVASSADAGAGGTAISLPGYDASGWTVAPARSTVLAALVGAGDAPADLYYSTTMRDAVDAARFAVPWWFRSLVRVRGAGRTHVCVQGVIPRADLWVNGRRVLDATTLAGAYRMETVDVTELVSPGDNALALLVHPGNPMEDLSIGWVDWAQPPPDHNMGPWRDVVVGRTGPVRLGAPFLTATLEQREGALRALLRVRVMLHNEAGEPSTAAVAGLLEGHGVTLRFSGEVTLGAGERRVLDVGAPGSGPGPLGPLVLSDPALWWPIGEGDQARYALSLSATVAGMLSDHVERHVGIRTVTSELCPGGGRQFSVNGRPVQVLGGGWSPDLLLRHDDARLAAQLALTAHMGLNAIRPEGKLENPEFYERCDELGIMVLPGWECCNKWEAAAGTGGTPWDAHDAEIAERSMASEAELLRAHPSVIGFLIGSDAAPPPETAAAYARALEGQWWDLPVVASATAQGSEVTGPSGMKMTGPYDWVPPAYWYSRDPELGGAVGFNSETSAGHTVPRTPSLTRMLSAGELDALWQHPSVPQYHSSPPSVFADLGVFATALAARYGAPSGAADFVGKAQLAAYEATRAQFEAYTSRAHDPEPATGVVYWMLNPPWPSLNWQLFDHELDTPGSYWGARKALERLHVFYAYDRRTVRVLNRTGVPAGPLSVVVRRWRPDGALVGDDRHEIPAIAPGAVLDVAPADAPPALTGAWFLELELYDAAARRSRNVYWLSTTEDVLDLDAATWFTTPVSTYADLRAVGSLGDREARRPRVHAAIAARRTGSDLHLALEVHHADPAGPPALHLHASVLGPGSGPAPVAPVFWDDNDVTVFRGQSVTLAGRLASAGGRRDGGLAVALEGFNLHQPLLLPLGEALEGAGA